MAEKTFYVYKIICIKDEWNGKFYIGSHYGYVDDNYTGSGNKINEYFKLYGKRGTYKKEILDISNDELYIKNKEREFITNFISDEKCLNLRKSAAGTPVGRKHTEEERRKISEATKGHKSWNKGKTNVYSETARNKMSDAKKGKIPWMKGKTHSTTTKENISKKLSIIKLGNTATKGRLWINNCITRKMIYPDELIFYLQNGWQLGKKLSS